VERSEPARAAWAELALAVGGFGIGTGEFAIMGLLPEVAGELNVTAPQAGHLISAYALGVVVGAPVLAVLTARAPRRTLLMALIAAFAVGNFASALAPGYLSLMLLRFLTGVPHGAFFGVAALVAAALAKPDGRARAVGRVMLGLTVATVLGAPLATGFGQVLSWRVAYGVVGGIGVVSLGLIARYVPDLKVVEGASPLRELGALARGQVWLTLAIGSIGSGGTFAVYTYITPALTSLAGMNPATVPVVLAVFGVGMILGNVVGSWLADRALMATIGGMLVWNAVVQGSFWFTAHHAGAAALTVLLIGCGFALVPALQTRLMDVAADAQTLAASLNHSAFNVANALGAWLGGLAISAGHGWSSTGWVGTVLALCGLGVFAVSAVLQARPREAKLQL
jgi:MFS transporter, DHA1 family, inner membrane transport protein